MEEAFSDLGFSPMSFNVLFKSMGINVTIITHHLSRKKVLKVGTFFKKGGLDEVVALQ
jgi:hypothetical protein